MSTVTKTWGYAQRGLSIISIYAGMQMGRYILPPSIWETAFNNKIAHLSDRNQYLVLINYLLCKSRIRILNIYFHFKYQFCFQIENNRKIFR